MKKNRVLALSASLASTIAMTISDAHAVPAVAYGVIAGNNDPADFDAAVDNLRKQNDKIRHMAAELVGTIQDQQLADPIALDGFDGDAVAAKLHQMGLISDIDTFVQAAKSIENGGFTGYINDTTAQMSAMDKTFGATGQQLTAWAGLSEEDRDAAVLNSDSSSPLQTIARLKTSVNKFDNYVTAGVLIYTELTQVANVVTGQTADADRELAEAA